MELNTLPKVEFAKKAPEEIEKSIVTIYEALTERKLADGDPVRLFLLSIATIIVQQRVIIDYVGKQNLLAYAEGDHLEHIGVLVGTDRLKASAAMTTLRITLSAIRTQTTIIPAGIRVTAGDEIFFATRVSTSIPAGAIQVDVEGICTGTGTIGNGYAAGELNIIVDPLPFVDSIMNITQTEGGADVEKDSSYRQRIHEAPESFSCAGPDGAYRYHAMRASALIADVSVTSPKPGEVEIRPLLVGGNTPNQEILDTVFDVLNDRKIRPLTDKVIVLPPEPVFYGIDLTYWIDREDAANTIEIQKKAEQAVADYELWQKSRLGRDINPSELIYLIRAAGVKRVEIREPVYIITSPAQIAIAEKKSVVFGGLEDG